MVIGFILWIFCGIVAASIARNKGRSGCGWLILGLIIGPFAFAVALLKPIPKEPQSGKENENAEATKKCPFCAEVIKWEAVKCRYCGSDLPEPDPNAIPPDPKWCSTCKEPKQSE